MTSAVPLTATGLYVAGAFEGTASFEGQWLTSAGITDGFVVSFDNIVLCLFDWAQRFGGTAWKSPGQLAVDVQGNCACRRLLPRHGRFRLANAHKFFTGWHDVCYDAQLGRRLPRQLSPLGGPGSNSARNIAFDSFGNRYVGGHFEGQATFPQGTLNIVAALSTVLS